MEPCPHSRRVRVIDKLGPMLDYGDSARAEIVASHYMCLDCQQVVPAPEPPSLIAEVVQIVEEVRKGIDDLPPRVKDSYRKRLRRHPEEK